MNYRRFRVRQLRVAVLVITTEPKADTHFTCVSISSETAEIAVRFKAILQRSQSIFKAGFVSPLMMYTVRRS